MALASGLDSNLIIVASPANITVAGTADSDGFDILFCRFANPGLPVSTATLTIAYL